MPRKIPPMIVLGIESSCDETGLALYAPGRGLLGQALHSQIDLHAAYGGVVPELASRDHIRRIAPLLRTLLAGAALSVTDIGAVAYTAGPGLAGALLVGAGFAEALAFTLDVPAVPVHHLEGHLLSPLLAAVPPVFPFVALLVSGGHTQLMRVTGVGHYELLGETLDDAAGEAFDKTAKLLGLGYPGGPQLAQRAATGRVGRFALPRPMLHSGDLNFSFSGLKTAVLTQVRQHVPGENDKADLCADIQQAIVDVLCAKSLAALEATGLQQLVVAGGVGANRALRAALDEAARARGAQVFYPEIGLCTDNGAMIAFAGALRLAAYPEAARTARGFGVRPRWPLDQI